MAIVGERGHMASYAVNDRAVAAARERIACRFRAAQWHHKAVELAAHDLLQLLDETSA